MALAEYYTNTLSRADHLFIRYWITPNILVGGNVCDKTDFEHLQKDFNIQAVINVDGGNSDQGKGIKNLLEFHVQDNGDPFPEEFLRQTVEFANFKLSERKNIYVHCHVGASRSPHFVYLLLRTYYKMPQELATRYIFNSLPAQHQPGYNQWTHIYTKSIEDAIKSWEEKPTREIIAEKYINKICINQPTATRYWLPNTDIMIGGSIIDKDDWQHLKNNYGIQAVINVETEHSDKEKDIDILCETQVPDNGTPFSKENIIEVLKFAKQHIDKNLYVHCQMGGSRSPGFGYGILRYCLNKSPDEALNIIDSTLKHIGGQGYGFHPYHQNYINSIEDAIKTL